MDVLILTLFITLVLVAGAVVLLVRGVRQGDFEQGDRLSLLPLEEDTGTSERSGADRDSTPAGNGAGTEPRIDARERKEQHAV